MTKVVLNQLRTTFFSLNLSSSSWVFFGFFSFSLFKIHPLVRLIYLGRSVRAKKIAFKLFIKRFFPLFWVHTARSLHSNKIKNLWHSLTNSRLLLYCNNVWQESRCNFAYSQKASYTYMRTHSYVPKNFAAQINRNSRLNIKSADNRLTYVF